MQARLNSILKHTVNVPALKLGIISEDESIPKTEEVVGQTVKATIGVCPLLCAVIDRELALDYLKFPDIDIM